MAEPEPQVERQLVNADGSPIPTPVTWAQRCASLSRRTKLIAGAVVVSLALLAAALGNLQKIQDYFAEPLSPPTVPPIIVEVENSSDEPVEIAARGNFFLWLPGPGARHTIGKYELKHADGSSFDAGTYTVPSNSKKRFFAEVMDQVTYGQVLERADCDIAFMLRKVLGGHKTTSDLPFTKDAINSYCAGVDIGAE